MNWEGEYTSDFAAERVLLFWLLRSRNYKKTSCELTNKCDPGAQGLRMLVVAFRYVSAVLRRPPNWGNETERIMS